MKHIEKKFLLQQQLTDQQEQRMQSLKFIPIDELSENNLREGFKENFVFANTENGFTFPIIHQKIEGKQCYIPMPDPTLIYFNNSQAALRHIKAGKKDLKAKLDFDNIQSEPYINEIYHYFGLTSQFIIFLFTSMESFINQMIPIDFKYEIERSNRTEIYDSDQIQRHLNFDEKLKKVLPKCTEKNFFTKQTKTTQLIENLKKFRNEIVHTKKDNKNSSLFYDTLVTKSLNFKYEETIKSVQKFMNFYKPDYVVECNCGKDL